MIKIDSLWTKYKQRGRAHQSDISEGIKRIDIQNRYVLYETMMTADGK